MEPMDDIILRGILGTDAAGIVMQLEDDKIEYKESFENGSKEAKAKYAKEMAALYNFEGGYLIFGVKDGTRELTGLNSFIPPDNADLVNDISTYFSPAIRFKTKLITINSKVVFIIYVEKRTSIPTVCLKSYPDVLTESVIYWRYSAQSSPIRPADKINLLKSLQGEETRRLTEIAEKDYKSKFRPRLWLNGGSHGGTEMTIRVENRGEIAHVDGFEVIEKNIEQLFLPTWKNYPIEKDRGVQLQIRPSGAGPNINWQHLHFKFAMNYHDAEGHKYQETIEVTNGHAKIIETKEV